MVFAVRKRRTLCIFLRSVMCTGLLVLPVNSAFFLMSLLGILKKWLNICLWIIVRQSQCRNYLLSLVCGIRFGTWGMIWSFVVCLISKRWCLNLRSRLKNLGLPPKGSCSGQMLRFRFLRGLLAMGGWLLMLMRRLVMIFVLGPWLLGIMAGKFIFFAFRWRLGSSFQIAESKKLVWAEQKNYFLLKKLLDLLWSMTG